VVRWHIATGGLQPLGVLGNSLVDFTALAIEDDPTRGAGAGLFLY
jgi:hypothetical protein